MFESKVPLCLFGEFIALPKPSQTSNDRAETSPEGGVASTALRRNGEWAKRRNGETEKRRCDDQKPLTRWGQEVGAPRSSPHRVRGFGHRVPPSPIRRFAYSPQSSVSLYSLGNML